MAWLRNPLARVVSHTSDTLERLRAYSDAGADCLYAPGLATLDQVRAVVAAVEQPVNVLIGRSSEPFTVAALGEIGVRRISVGSALARAAMGALLAASRELIEAGTFQLGAAALPHPEADAIFAS